MPTAWAPWPGKRKAILGIGSFYLEFESIRVEILLQEEWDGTRES